MCEIRIVEESVIKVEKIKEEEDDIEYNMEQPNDDTKNVEENYPGNVTVKKEFCPFVSTEDQYDSEEKYLEPVITHLLHPKEETEDDMLKDTFVPRDDAAAVTKEETKYQIPDAASRCAEEVPTPLQQQLPALSVETEGSGTNKLAVSALPGQSDVSGNDIPANRSGLNQHKRTRSDSKQYKCTECDYTSTSSFNVKVHHRIHSGLKPYKCTECAYTAAQNSNLKIHERIHSGLKPYKCTDCGYSATQISQLKVHQRIHSGLKPYKCTQCDYTAKQTSQLKVHQRMHTGVKPYKCLECDFSSVVSSNLKRHQRVHTGIKPFKCTDCDYTTADNSNLKLHRRIHSGIKPFKCRECDYSCVQNSQLKRHQQIHKKAV